MEELKAMYPVCTLIKPDGNRCGSPALTGANFCFHHIGGKLPKPKPETRSVNSPIKLIYPSNHQAIQHNLFLVMQALGDGKIDNATANTYNRLLRSCELNLRQWQTAKSKMDWDDTEEQMMPLPEEEVPETSDELGAPQLALSTSKGLEKMWEGAQRDCLDGQSPLGAPHLEKMWENSAPDETSDESSPFSDHQNAGCAVSVSSATSVVNCHSNPARANAAQPEPSPRLPLSQEQIRAQHAALVAEYFSFPRPEHGPADPLTR